MRTLLSITLLCLGGVAFSQEERLSDRPIQFCVPDMEQVTVRRDLVYKPAAPGSLERCFDLYLPPDTTEERRLPVVVFVNGLGLPELKNTAVYTSWARAAAAHGLAAVTFDVDQNSIEEDIDRLVSHLKFNVDGLPIDGQNMCWWACGRNVDRALQLALQEDRTYLQCLVVYYGMPQYIPKMRAKLPLLIVKAGRDDPRLNERIDRFALGAASMNRELTYIVYPDGKSAFDVFDSSKRSHAIIQDTLDFMTLHLSPALQLETEISALIRQGYASWKDNQWVECARLYREVLALDEDIGHAHFMVGLSELYLGNFEVSVKSFEESLERGFRCPASTYNIACAYARWGKKDLAFRYLYEAREHGFNDLALLKEDPDLNSLRGDVRFGELLQHWDIER